VGGGGAGPRSVDPPASGRPALPARGRGAHAGKKDLLKTAGAKYVAPLPIECRLQESALIEWALVVGDERPFAAALVVPDWAALRACTASRATPTRWWPIRACAGWSRGAWTR
jgi:hypothetical protein